MTILDKIRKARELADRATPGEWQAKFMMRAGGKVDMYWLNKETSTGTNVRADADLIAAAVNLLRDDELLGLAERAEAAEAKLAELDARANLYEARYRRVRDLHNTFQHYVDGELVRVDKIDDAVYDACIDGLIADAQEQIDAAAQGEV